MFKRNIFLPLIAFVFFLSGSVFAGSTTIDYEPGVIKKALANRETVFVDYAADWCGTCKRQERVIGQLRGQNPAYNKAITFVRVDWDFYRGDKIRTDHNIPRRSTLILLRGDVELGRIVAGTSTEQIQSLLDKAL